MDSPFEHPLKLESEFYFSICQFYFPYRFIISALCSFMFTCNHPIVTWPWCNRRKFTWLKLKSFTTQYYYYQSFLGRVQYYLKLKDLVLLHTYILRCFRRDMLTSSMQFLLASNNESVQVSRNLPH